MPDQIFYAISGDRYAVKAANLDSAEKKLDAFFGGDGCSCADKDCLCVVEEGAETIWVSYE